METVKDFFHNMKKNMDSALEKGDVMLANEISANIMVGSVMVLMAVISLVALVMNELDVFTVNKISMRIAVAIALVVEIPAVTFNSKCHGDNPLLKKILPVDLVIMCAVLAACLGHNVTLIMSLPVLISIRYCDEKLTMRVAICTAVCFALAAVYCGLFGIVNLNIVRLSATLTVDGALRAPVMDAGFDRGFYTKLLFQHEFLPRFLIQSVLSYAAIKIAQYGRSTIDTQAKITAKSARISTELELANQIQSSMLPCIFPAFPDHQDLELYAFNVPAKEVGGDFYDYFRIDMDHVGLVMADVSGKGVGAALFMMISKTIIKNYLTTALTPAEAVMKANADICENNQAGLFVTVWAGIYEISTGKLTYTNAGHNPPVIHRKGEDCKYLNGPHGLVVGALETTRYRNNMIELSKGDEIFLYTDGVTEATSVSDELFGEDRLLDCLNGINGLNMKAQVTGILEAITAFTAGREQFDDITMMGMKIL